MNNVQLWCHIKIGSENKKMEFWSVFIHPFTDINNHRKQKHRAHMEKTIPLIQFACITEIIQYGITALYRNN